MQNATAEAYPCFIKPANLYLWAMQHLSQAPGFYRFMVGDIEVICVNDGPLSSDINAVAGVSTEQAHGEVMPGVTAVALPGHTPGNTGYRVASQGQELLIRGDIIHWPVVQFALPDAAMTYDVGPTQATATRCDILRKAASGGLLVAGMHLYFPGLTRVRQEGDAFAMVPVPSAYGEFGH